MIHSTGIRQNCQGGQKQGMSERCHNQEDQEKPQQVQCDIWDGNLEEKKDNRQKKFEEAGVQVVATNDVDSFVITNAPF